MRNRENVIFVPDWRENPYQTQLAQALASLGINVSYSNPSKRWFPLCRLAKAHKEAGVIHLHWINPIIVRHFWSTNRVKRWIRLAGSVADILLCKLMGLRVIWTIHNITSHESPDPMWERTIRRWFARSADRCIVHSVSAIKFLESEYDVSLAKKTHVTPHASYIGNYKPSTEAERSTLRGEYNLRPNTFVVLFIGAIRRYKGLEELIDAFKLFERPNAKLLICGKSSPNDYGILLTEAVKSDNRIVFNDRYVEDDLMAAHLNIADVVVLPFSQTLTSGSALLAMSFKKALVLPQSAKVFDQPGPRGAIYFKDGELLLALQQAQGRDLEEMGQYNLSIAEKSTWNRMALITKSSYTLEKIAK